MAEPCLRISLSNFMVQIVESAPLKPDQVGQAVDFDPSPFIRGRVEKGFCHGCGRLLPSIPPEIPDGGLPQHIRQSAQGGVLRPSKIKKTPCKILPK